MADFDNRFDREDGIRTMDALDKLLKDIPSDYDEVDVANHLLHFREQAKAELSALRERAEKAEAERDALKEANAHSAELLKTAKDLFDGTHELCDEVDSEEWLWKWRVRYYLGETDIPVHEMPQDMRENA